MPQPSEIIKPGPNPSSQGVNPENALYEKWKTSQDQTSKQAVEAELLPYLRRHASKVCWIVLHSYQPHLVEEIAQDAILEISGFLEKSLFSTWFHARAYYRTRLELRRYRIRKEQSLDSDSFGNLAGSSSSIEASALVHDILGKLSEQDRNFVDLKVNHGLTDEELAIHLDMSRAWVQKKWNKLRGKLRVLYGRKSR